jgi:hypothetical protein
MISAVGAELSTDAETVSVAVAGRPDGAARIIVNLTFHGPADGGIDAISAACADPDCLGLFADAQQIAGLTDDLRAAGVNITFLSAIEVAAASYLFRSLARRRKLATGGHEALAAAVKYAKQRPLAAAFGFERKRTEVDMAPLNASAFSVYGVKQYEDGAEPGAWILTAPAAPPSRLPELAAGITGPGMSSAQAPATAPPASHNGNGDPGPSRFGWAPEDR